MDREHAVAVLRKVIAYCPAMKLNDDSRQAWAEALADANFQDSLDAVAVIGAKPLDPGEQLWIQPGHILAEVRRIRARRLDDFDVANLTGAPADVDDYLAWRRATNRAIADGHQSGLPQVEGGKHQVSADFIRELRARSRGQLPGKDIP